MIVTFSFIGNQLSISQSYPTEKAGYGRGVHWRNRKNTESQDGGAQTCHQDGGCEQWLSCSRPKNWPSN